ncbi:MAG TPA: ankyrin repeat domain-containing protein, partial [Limnobacter sp.]|nr:ankyrin repeat domain-containing protein [Limnobacter sp.]
MNRRNALAFLGLALMSTRSKMALAGAFEDFFKAIRFDDEHRLKNLLLKGMDANSTDEKGFPAITVAMLQDSPRAVAVLLRSPGLNPNQLDPRGESPLMVASALDRPEWVSALVAKGAKQGGNGQWTALHNAAASGSSRSVEILLKAGGRVDVLSPNDTTPLMMAARQGREQTARLLLKMGANPALKNQSGLDAAAYAL